MRGQQPDLELILDQKITKNHKKLYKMVVQNIVMMQNYGAVIKEIVRKIKLRR